MDSVEDPNSQPQIFVWPGPGCGPCVPSWAYVESFDPNMMRAEPALPDPLTVPFPLLAELQHGDSAYLIADLESLYCFYM